MSIEISFDYTFCSGVRCKRRGFCARWTKNLEEIVKAKGYKIEDLRISIAEFSDFDGTCRDGKFIPVADIPASPDRQKDRQQDPPA